MVPHEPTPEWAIRLFDVINKYGDQEVLEASLDLVAGLSDLEGDRGDAAQAVLDHGFRKTRCCDRACREYFISRREAGAPALSASASR